MSLTEISYYIRKILPVAIFVFIFFVFFYFLIKLTWPIMFPPAPRPLAVDPIFGKLTKIKFFRSIDYPPNPQFILDTIEGEPVTATQTAKVYYLPQTPPRFGYLQTIYLMAKTLDFDTELTKYQIEGENATFQDDEKKLIVNIANFNFEFKYNYEENETIFETAVIPGEDLIKERVKQLLRVLGRYPEELAQGKENLIYSHYNAQTKEFETDNNKSNANVVEIDFYRPDIDSLLMLSSTYFNSHNYAVVLFQNDQVKVLKAQIKFFEKESQRTGIYPVITGDQAWQELQEQRGIIVSAGRNDNKITIKKMFLAYYDPDVYQEYLQPVYAFLGNNGFAAYIPAIKTEYLE